MRLLPLFVVNFVLILATGCSQNTPAGNNSIPEPTPSSAQLVKSSLAINNSIDSISTKPLTSKPIRVNINNLPKPFSSTSASKPPQILPIPANPTLRVPPGFVVNVFAKDLDAPRWLALTPNGDVLVTETRQNRISLLRDNNGDGVVDEKKTFATAVNGLNIPFGMAFAENTFFLGNTNAVLRFPYSKGQQNLNGKGEKIATLPSGGYNQH